jgi:two-component system sensor histidine kinase BaeS
LRAIVSEVAASLRPYATSRGVLLREGNNLELLVSADPLRLRQILSNLLNNGAKSKPTGGEVSVDAVIDGAFVRIAVADTGIGIAAEECSRIFDKFYQVGFTQAGVREGARPGHLPAARRDAGRKDLGGK